MHLLKSLACGLLVSLMAAPAFAAQAPIAKVIAYAPSAEAVGAEGTRALDMKAPIFESDEVRTGEKGMVQMIFNDDTTMTLDAMSSAQMSDFANTGSSSDRLNVHLGRGLLRMVTGEVVKRNPAGFAITTPHSTIGIRGTGFSVSVTGDRTLVSAFQLTGGKGILVRNNSTGSTVVINSTDMAVEVTAQGIRQMPFSELEAFRTQFLAREPLGGVANGSNPSDSLQAGNSREDAMLNKEEPNLLSQNSGTSSDTPTDPDTPVEPETPTEPETPVEPDIPVVPDEPATPTYSTADVSASLSGFSIYNSVLPDMKWDGSLNFKADIATGEATDASFTLSPSNIYTSDDTVSGTVTGTGGSSNAGTLSPTSFNLGSFALSGSLTLTNNDGMSETFTLEGSDTAGETKLSGSMSLDSSTGKGTASGTSGSVNLFGSSDTNGSELEIVVAPQSLVDVSAELANGWDGAKNTWKGNLNFTADLNSGFIQPGSASFDIEGVNTNALTAVTVGTVSGTGGSSVAPGDRFTLDGFTVTGTYNGNQVVDGNANFDGTITDLASRKATVDSGSVSFGENNNITFGGGS